jgi:hypothetical protein
MGANTLEEGSDIETVHLFQVGSNRGSDSQAIGVDG